MSAPHRFNPDYATPPGNTLLEWLEGAGMTQSELAQRLDKSEKFVSQLINGKVPLSRQVAIDLESVTRIPAKMWNRLETNYRDTIDTLQRDALCADVGDGVAVRNAAAHVFTVAQSSENLKTI